MVAWDLLVINIVVVACLYSILTLALNLQLGYTGIVNFGLVVPFFLGGYTSTLLTVPSGRYPFPIGLGMPLVVGVISAIIISGIGAYVFGFSLLKMRPEQLAITILAFGELLRYIAINEIWLTNGTSGVIGIPVPFPEMFGGPNRLYLYLFIFLFSLIIIYFLTNRLCKSPCGRTFKAIMCDENIASSLRKNVFNFKMKSWVISAMITGYAGSLFAFWQTGVLPGDFTPEMTFFVWSCLIIGGLGSNRGALIGAVLLTSSEEIVRIVIALYGLPELALARLILLNILFILILKFKPMGLMGERRL